MSVEKANKRFQVEVASDSFTAVLADRMNVHESGALVFTSGHPFDPVVVIAYAPGTWLTVHEEYES